MQASTLDQRRLPRRLPAIAIRESSSSSSNSEVDEYTKKIDRQTKTSQKDRGKHEKETQCVEDKQSIYEEGLKKYLKVNETFLDAYVEGHVSIDRIERWYLSKKRIRPAEHSETELPRFTRSRIPVHHSSALSLEPKWVLPAMKDHLPVSLKEESMRKQVEVPLPINNTLSAGNFFKQLTTTLRKDPRECQIVWALASTLDVRLNSEAFRVYKVSPHQPDKMFVYSTNQKDPRGMPGILKEVESSYRKIVGEVARTRCYLRLDKTIDNDRFPPMPYALFNHFGVDDSFTANHVIYVPIFNIKGQTSYIVELWRKIKFLEYDEETLSCIVSWGSVALHYSTSETHRHRENKMSVLFLDVARAIFNNLMSLDMLIKGILECAQKLVNADRASLFQVDYKNKELVSTVFDLKIEKGINRDLGRQEIRMPISKGIAGYVANTGETINICNVYADERFNREVDEATGYKTTSILCMPIQVGNLIIGVVQMINKRNKNESFSRNDELNFKSFSTFFGLALQQAMLHDGIRRKEQMYRVAMEVLSYHNTCKESEAINLLKDQIPVRVELDDYFLDPFKLDDYEKCKAVLTMFDDLFGMLRFDRQNFARFLLSVKKNYRNVPYHNFNHGWAVGQTMYAMLKNGALTRFDPKARLALFVASLCHDLDHRGFTNKYMIDTEAPLAAMYAASTLEHHHFNITVTILHQEGHNFLPDLSRDDFKQILSYIKKCILATDLAQFFPNLAKLTALTNEQNSEQFHWTDETHRDLVMALAMTAADLSAATKPWEVQNKTVQLIFEEFYIQGDKERAAGRKPIPMMDRNKPQEQPNCQVEFLSKICIPCYKMVAELMPETKPMLIQAKANFDEWQKEANKTLAQLLLYLPTGDKSGSSEENSSAGAVRSPSRRKKDCNYATQESKGRARNNSKSYILWEEDDLLQKFSVMRRKSE